MVRRSEPLGVALSFNYVMNRSYLLRCQL